VVPHSNNRAKLAHCHRQATAATTFDKHTENKKQKADDATRTDSEQAARQARQQAAAAATEALQIKLHALVDKQKGSDVAQGSQGAGPDSQQPDAQEQAGSSWWQPSAWNQWPKSKNWLPASSEETEKQALFKLAKALKSLLEHGGTKPQLGSFRPFMDKDGWANIDDVEEELKQKREKIKHVVFFPSDGHARFQHYQSEVGQPEYIRRFPQYAAGTKVHPPEVSLGPPFSIFGTPQERAARLQEEHEDKPKPAFSQADSAFPPTAPGQPATEVVDVDTQKLGPGNFNMAQRKALIEASLQKGLEEDVDRVARQNEIRFVEGQLRRAKTDTEAGKFKDRLNFLRQVAPAGGSHRSYEGKAGKGEEAQAHIEAVAPKPDDVSTQNPPGQKKEKAGKQEDDKAKERARSTPKKRTRSDTRAHSTRHRSPKVVSPTTRRASRLHSPKSDSSSSSQKKTSKARHKRGRSAEKGSRKKHSRKHSRKKSGRDDSTSQSPRD
jgi:hypothetical protein